MYKPSKHIKTFHIAGFQHYDGAFVLDKLKPCKKLNLLDGYGPAYRKGVGAGMGPPQFALAPFP